MNFQKWTRWLTFFSAALAVVLIAALSYHRPPLSLLCGILFIFIVAIGIFIFQIASHTRWVEDKHLKMRDELKVTVQEKTSALQKAQYQLVQQERLRALGQMASGIAHDFNNALAPILGYSELLLDTSNFLEDRKKSMEYLQMINTSAKDAANIVRHLREFYRAREKNESFTRVDVDYLLKQASILTQPKWKTQALTKGIDIKMDVHLGKVPFMEGNEAELREVLTNLIFNAVDAMPKGGTITLRSSTRQGKILLEVQDTGGGMSEEIRQHCFEPFYTTKGENGTGLGLAMVYGIVQRHGGDIEIQSVIGKGTTFLITLPAQGLEKTSSSPDRDQPTALRPLKILYVEDEANAREVIVEYLKRDGHEVEQAADGMEGLRKFLLGQYDLVITDKAMPCMTGVQLAIAIKKRDANKPVVLLSGTEGETAMQGTVDAVVVKPATMEALRRAMSDLFSKRAIPH